MGQPAAQGAAAASPVHKASWAALVVDDDPGVRQSLRLFLEAAGARVLGVATGCAALEALERSQFEVVFLDLWLRPEAVYPRPGSPRGASSRRGQSPAAEAQRASAGT